MASVNTRTCEKDVSDNIKIPKTNDAKRYALFPILDEEAYSFYQRQEMTHWSSIEMDFVADLKDYDKASSRVKRIIDTILAFFLSGDGAISDNITYRFLTECKTYEEQAMFISQLHIELVHAETYGLAAFTFKRTEHEIADLIESVQKTPCVIKKMQFMEKWTHSSRPRWQRLLAFACAEGIFFCTLFGYIYWFRSKGWFPNFVFANELIANDESLHRDYGCFLFKREIVNLIKKEIEPIVREIINESIDIEDEFVHHSQKGEIKDDELGDMTIENMKKYCRLIGDNLSVNIGFEPVYKVKNPFTWMNDISMEQKTNFYEARVGAYKKKSLSDIMNWKKRCGLQGDQNKAYQEPSSIDF